MAVNFDCSAMWMKDCLAVASAFNVDPIYLKHEYEEEVMDFRVRIQPILLSRPFYVNVPRKWILRDHFVPFFKTPSK